MLTFEQLKPALHKWAIHFQSNKYDRWELINAVWEMGNVQKLPVTLASMRIKFDMIDYMRGEENFRRRQRDDARGVFVPKYISAQTLIGDECELLELLEAPNKLGDVDTDDYFGWLVKGFSCQEKLAIKLRFIKNLSIAEIGRAIGLSDARIFQILINLLKRIRVRLVADNPDLRSRGSSESIALRSPQSTKDRLGKRRGYNRDYYQKNKGRILTQRKIA